MKPSAGHSRPAENGLDRLAGFWPAAVWLGVITYLSTMPGVSLPDFNLIAVDKLAHAAVYGVQTWLLLYSADRVFGPSARAFSRGFWAFGLATAYGVLMEFVQYWFFPGRYYEYDDMLANAIGAATGWAAFRLWRKRRQ